MSSLAEVEQGTTTTRPSTRCAFGAILEAADGADREWLEDRISRPKDYPAEKLAGILTTAGHEISPSSVRTHRRSGCACARVAA